MLDGDTVPPEGVTAVNLFAALVSCGQTAGWIRMPLATEVGLDPVGIVLDGDPAPRKRA